MGKILFAVTTYNQLKYTKLCVESLEKIKDADLDILVVDDASTDDTVKYCKDKNIKIITKERGIGLTHSWNEAYKVFCKTFEYDYLIISNNDVLVPHGSLKEIIDVFKKWNFSVVVPMSSIAGAGHNAHSQGIENLYQGVDSEYVNNPENYQNVQDSILNIKADFVNKNNKYMLDPVRMKMFNGFFFAMNRNIIRYERGDGMLFDPKFQMFKAEDEFNWASLIPNDDFPALCKTSFIYHFKGMLTGKIKNYADIANTEDYFKARENINSK